MANDDDSIKSIENTLGQMSVTNNANYQAVNGEVKELCTVTTTTTTTTPTYVLPEALFS